MPREWTDDERRRADEEEAHYWDSVEEEHRADGAKQEARQATVEEMVGWFHEQFEDSQVETPRDSEDDSYIYPWGGPFEASDVLYGIFGEKHDEELIQQAVESVESNGTTEWAPTSSGEYYEHPQPDDNESESVAALSQLTASALERLDALEAIVAALPGASSQIGHNAPPEAIGIPPYTDEDGHAARPRSPKRAQRSPRRIRTRLSSRRWRAASTAGERKSRRGSARKQTRPLTRRLRIRFARSPGPKQRAPLQQPQISCSSLLSTFSPIAERGRPLRSTWARNHKRRPQKAIRLARGAARSDAAANACGVV